DRLARPDAVGPEHHAGMAAGPRMDEPGVDRTVWGRDIDRRLGEAGAVGSDGGAGGQEGEGADRAELAAVQPALLHRCEVDFVTHAGPPELVGSGYGAAAAASRTGATSLGQQDR